MYRESGNNLLIYLLENFVAVLEAQVPGIPAIILYCFGSRLQGPLIGSRKWLLLAQLLFRVKGVHWSKSDLSLLSGLWQITNQWKRTYALK